MSQPTLVALRAYLAPMPSFRGLRLGLAVGFLAFSLIGLAFVLEHLLPRMFGNLLRSLQLVAIVPGIPLTAILVSEMSLRDGIRQRTLLYALLSPVPRSVLAVVRTLTTAVLLAVGGMIVVTVIRLLDGMPLGPLPREYLAILLGSMAYTALFGFFHLAMRRGLIAGLVFYFLLDQPLAQLPFALRRLSPSYHLAVLADRVIDMHLPISVPLPETSIPAAAVTLLGITAIFLAATAIVFNRKSLGELC
jgi:hypothetical protein